MILSRRVLAVLLLFAAAPAAAQRLQVRTYTESDGLPSSMVWDVTQDREGRMWFATRSGVARYDGVEWSLFGPAEGLALTNSELRVGPDDTVWSLGTGAPFRVFRFDGDRWEPLPGAPLPRPVPGTSLAVFGDGSRVAVGSELGVHLWDGAAWTLLDRTGGLPSSHVLQLTTWSSHLVAGTSEGWALIDEGRVIRAGRPAGIADPSVLGAAVSPTDGSLWLAGYSWLGQLGDDGDLRVVHRLETALPYQLFSAGVVLAGDAHGGVYMGNPMQLYFYHPEEGFSTVDRSSGLVTDGATSVFVDREGNVWVAGTRGVTKIVSRRFLTYRQEHGLFEDEVSAVLERRDGSFVLGHPRGLSLVRGERIEHIRLVEPERDPLNAARVLDLDEDAEGRLWIAASHLGLARLTGDRFEWFRDAAGITGQVTSVRVTRDQRVWVSTDEIPLLEWRDGAAVAVDAVPDGNYVRRLFAAESGGLLAALGHSGVLRLEEGRPTRRAVGPSDAENSVFAIHEDRDGTTWVGTAAGLRLIEGDRFVLPDGIPRIQRPVYFILRDHDERLWIGTDNGALRWDGRSLSGFSVAEGLAAPETNRAAGCLDSRGRIWIGTNFGLSIYREEWERAEPVAPLVRLEWVLAGGEERELLEEIDLRAHDNDLTFRARAVSFVDEGRVLLHSRLAGLEPAAQVTTGPARRELRYASLPPGRYRLEVQAESVDGTVSDVVLSPWITIAPPLWRRPAFLGVAVLLLAGLLFLTHRFLAQRHYASELAAEVERRMARIREVEEELTRSRRLESLAVFAGGLAHDFNNLLTVILGNLSILRLRLAGREINTRPLEDAEGAVKRATELTGQFLTFARGGGPIREARDVAAIVRESAALVFAGTNATCDLKLSEGLWNAEVDAGQLTQVFNNLMLNAVQAMPGGGTVTVRAGNVEEVPAPMEAGKGVHVSISDEGPGIAAELRDRIFDPFFSTKEAGRGLGLASAHSIVSRHGGRLTADSAPGPGATFHLFLPATDRAPELPTAPPPVSAEGAGRVLIMDDEPEVRTVVAEILQGLGYSVECAVDGSAAVERYAAAGRRGDPFDVVILDLTVRGGMGGRAALDLLRDLDPDVRAVAASGYSDDPVMADPVGFGFRAAIPKPFRPDELARALAPLLRVEKSR